MLNRLIFFLVFSPLGVFPYPYSESISSDDNGVDQFGEFYLPDVLQSTDSNYLIEVGEELFDRSEYEAAIKCFDKAIEIQPDKRSFGGRAECYKRLGKLKLAAADMKKAVRDRIDRLELIELYMKVEDWSEAVDETLKLEDDHFNIVQSANQFCDEKRYNEAIRCFNHVLITEPRASYYKLRGECYVSMGLLEKAREDFETAVELDKSISPAEKDGYDGMLLCLALFQFEKFEDIAKEIPSLKSIQQTTLITSKFLTEKKFKEAIPSYSAAIKKFPEWGLYYENRAKCYKEIGDLENAILDLQRAMELDPSCISCCLELIDLFVTTKRYADARMVLKNNAAILKDAPPSKESWLLNVEKEIYGAIEKAKQEMEKTALPALER